LTQKEWKVGGHNHPFGLIKTSILGEPEKQGAGALKKKQTGENGTTTKWCQKVATLPAAKQKTTQIYYLPSKKGGQKIKAEPILTNDFWKQQKANKKTTRTKTLFRTKKKLGGVRRENFSYGVNEGFKRKGKLFLWSEENGGPSCQGMAVGRPSKRGRQSEQQ